MANKNGYVNSLGYDPSKQYEENATKEATPFLTESITHGARSAWNMFNMQIRDLELKAYKRERERLAELENKATTEFDKNGIEILKNKYSEELSQKGTQENFDYYKQQELKNLREYNAFYELLEDTPTRLLTSLSYGATKNILNPIEVGKNIILDQLTFGGFKGIQAAGWGLKVARYGFNVLVDTVDNYFSNKWEDSLLGNIKKSKNEEILEAFGGAAVGNGIIPAVKVGGKVIKGLGTDIANILNDTSFKEISKNMTKVDVLDLSSKNPIKTLKNTLYSEKIKTKNIPDDTFGVNLKREIENIENLNETGFDSSPVNFREMFDRLNKIITTSHEEIKTKVKLGEEYDVSKADTKYDRNVAEIVNNFIVKPIEVTERMYKNEYKNKIRLLTDKYDEDILNKDSWYKNINERLAEDLEDNIVARSLIDSGFHSMQKFTSKEGVDLDSTKLQKFGDDVIKEFREAIGRGVTYTTEENGTLFISHPKYNKYFNSSLEYKDFDDTINKAVNDYVEGELSHSEIRRILFYQKDRYDTFKITENLESSFEGDVVAKIQKVIKEKGINPKKEELKEFIKIDNLQSSLNKIKERKINIALLSLTFNKKKAYHFFANTKDFLERKKILGDRIDNIAIIGEETQEEALNRVVRELFLTTKNLKAVAEDVEGTYVDFANGISKDLIDVVKDNFVGSTTKKKMENFVHFMDLFEKDNISMLNSMEKITTGTKASITSLGVPIYKIENIVKDGGGLLQLAFDIPVLRKDYKNILKLSTHSPSTYTTVEKTFKRYMNNYISNKSVFKNNVQTGTEEIFESAMFYTLRNYFLAFSGMKEIFSHPALTAVKATKYYNGNFFRSAGSTAINAPKTYLTAMLKELKPIADTSYALKKLYRGLGSIIGDEELAALEFARSMETLSPIREGSQLVNGVKIGAEIAQKVNLHIQGSMQNLRYVCSRYQGIDIIKRLLKSENFDNLDSSTKDLLKSLHIADNEKFLNWKKEVNDVGLKNALYVNGKSDITKYLHSYITDELYSEDPMKSIRNPRTEVDTITKLRTMFTTFTNDMLNYFSDTVRYYKDKDGLYRSRLSKTYLKYLKENPTENIKNFVSGVGGLTVLGIATLGGEWWDSIVFQGSKDEEIEARLAAIKDSGYNRNEYITDIAKDVFLKGTALDSVTQGGNILDSTLKNISKGKFLPQRISNIYNAISGTPVYNENPYGMDWYVKGKYDKLVMEDKSKRFGFDEFDKLMTITMADTLAENGEISQEENLNIRRKLGVDDRKEAREIENSKNYKTILNVSIAQGGIHKSEEEFQKTLINNIDKSLEENTINASKKEVLKKLEVSDKLYRNLENSFELTAEEEKELQDYMKTVSELNHLNRLMIKANKTREIIEKRYR